MVKAQRGAARARGVLEGHCQLCAVRACVVLAAARRAGGVAEPERRRMQSRERVRGRGAQALPSFLTALPLTHLDVSACRAADLSVVAEMTSLVTLSLQVSSCRARPRAPACAHPPAACRLRSAADRDEARSAPCSVCAQATVGTRRAAELCTRQRATTFQADRLWRGV